MLSTLEGVNICAPMVRYSKLAFRHLVSQYETHITFTPMILAQEFSRSAIGRRSDFSTSPTERGIFSMTERNSSRKRKVRGSLIAQFAANDSKTFADACELIFPHVDGVDLNCGCPQKWAYQEKIGSYLLRQPDTVRDIVRAARDRTGWNFPISVKIRLDPDPKRTNQLIETAIHAGASMVTVHGRTRHQASTHPVDLAGISFAVECGKGEVPIVANGDVWSYTEAEMIRKTTGVQGVMSARGLLANPALFAGYESTPNHAISSFMRLATAYTLPFALIHRHIAFMLETAPLLRDGNPHTSLTQQKAPLSRAARAHYHSLTSIANVVDFLEEETGIVIDSPTALDPWAPRVILENRTA
ncbi:FMN-linked oxidoreductase [Clavulina sp. PMI_390]|nr:FMN-linked oxidoreductase [Clavulina sp. PMI_390]